MTTVGSATGAGRGMGLACAEELVAIVDVLLLVDRDEASVTEAAVDLSESSGRAVEPFVLDVTHCDGLARLATRASDRGTLRAVAHAAGISPTMADWRRIFTIDLVGTAMLVEVLRPLATSGTAMVCFASMAPLLGLGDAGPAADAALDAPLDERLLDRIRDALGPRVEASGTAYAWAKRGVHRFVQQEAEGHPVMEALVQQTPLSRVGRPEEVAAVVGFLLSDRASFVNGIDVLVDGGVCAAVRGPARQQ